LEAIVIGILANDQIALTDIGAGALIGGALLESAVRLGAALGLELKIDGWREGMFLGALAAFAFWVFGELEA